jgi:hypothetical protein
VVFDEIVGPNRISLAQNQVPSKLSRSTGGFSGTLCAKFYEDFSYNLSRLKEGFRLPFPVLEEYYWPFLLVLGTRFACPHLERRAIYGHTS